jgi:predicted secreted protein
VQDVKQLIKKYEEMKKMTKVLANPDSKKARSMLRNFGLGLAIFAHSFVSCTPSVRTYSEVRCAPQPLAFAL